MRIRLREINRDDVRFETTGDYEEEYEEFNKKLNIINKYFPFETVKGYYVSDKGLDLYFDEDIHIEGVITEPPYIVSFYYRNHLFYIDIHPHDIMGGFNSHIFEEQIESIYEQVNTISLVLAHDGYTVFSKNIKKSELEYYKFCLVSGNQYEGELIDSENILGEVSKKILFDMIED